MQVCYQDYMKILKIWRHFLFNYIKGNQFYKIQKKINYNNGDNIYNNFLYPIEQTL